MHQEPRALYEQDQADRRGEPPAALCLLGLVGQLPPRRGAVGGAIPPINADAFTDRPADAVDDGQGAAESAASHLDAGAAGVLASTHSWTCTATGCDPGRAIVAIPAPLPGPGTDAVSPLRPQTPPAPDAPAPAPPVRGRKADPG